MILRHIGNSKNQEVFFKIIIIRVLCRILKDPCGGKVFPSRSDFKHCRQMFSSQKEIMRRVGFTDEVKKKTKIFHYQTQKKCSN